ncbi:hypothetical protein JCM14076_28690 [Methylosoma difficile]
MNKLSIIKKKLSNPRVRRRLKIGLFIYSSVIVLGLEFKLAYDIGYFDAQALKKEKSDELTAPRPVLTLDAAQRIVTGALKEDPTNPKTLVIQIVDNDQKLSTIILENNKQKKVAWIVDMRLFFKGDLLNGDGYNLTEGIEKQNNIIHSAD